MENEQQVARKTLRMLSVCFDSKLDPWEVPQFRGAMIDKVGVEHDWFHNHNNGNDGAGYHYRYPQIQYKLDKQNPMLLCLNDCTQEAQRLFEQDDWGMRIGEAYHEMRIKRLRVNEFTLQQLEVPKSYRIHNWLALNQENYTRYHKSKSIAKRLGILEQLLTSHILAFYKAMGCWLEEELEVSITQELPEKLLKHKGIRHQAFNLHFECNCFLPNFIGLGRGSSHGYGVIKEDRVFEQKK